jgi:Holliday junction resolvasome RuvABC endonuclease subunit
MSPHGAAGGIDYKVIVGIDQSLNSTGVVVLDAASGAPLFSTAVALNGKKGTPKLFGAERLVYVRNAVFNILREYPADFAVIEGYSFGSRGSSIFDLGEIGGAIRILVHDLGIPFEVVPPKTLKKYMAGNGNATKEEMAEAVERKHGLKFATTDEVDAFSLAYMAREVGPNRLRAFFRDKKKK